MFLQDACVKYLSREVWDILFLSDLTSFERKALCLQLCRFLNMISVQKKKKKLKATEWLLQFEQCPSLLVQYWGSSVNRSQLKTLWLSMNLLHGRKVTRRILFQSYFLDVITVTLLSHFRDTQLPHSPLSSWQGLLNTALILCKIFAKALTS